MGFKAAQLFTAGEFEAFSSCPQLPILVGMGSSDQHTSILPDLIKIPTKHKLLWDTHRL